jgi:hypothetical protein
MDIDREDLLLSSIRSSEKKFDLVRWCYSQPLQALRLSPESHALDLFVLLHDLPSADFPLDSLPPTFKQALRLTLERADLRLRLDGVTVAQGHYSQRQVREHRGSVS